MFLYYDSQYQYNIKPGDKIVSQELQKEEIFFAPVSSYDELIILNPSENRQKIIDEYMFDLEIDNYTIQENITVYSNIIYSLLNNNIINIQI